MATALYFDCFSGISGDMTVAALLDLGIDSGALIEEYKKLSLHDYVVKIGRTKKLGISATDFEVVQQNRDHHHRHQHEPFQSKDDHNPGHKPHAPHRNLYSIISMIEASNLSNNVKERSIQIFQTLAAAESRVHDAPLEEIHFHEVGAVDSILDIVGTCICLDWLGVEEVYASPLHMGTGFLHCEHGILPAEAPATMEILKGVPVYSTGLKTELVTPTGAAIVKTLVREFRPLPDMIIENVGYGAGKKDLEIPNLLRVIQTSHKPEAVILLETNIDDMNPEVYSYLFPLLMNNGALDVFLTHVIMKKSRPGIVLSVLCPQQVASHLEDILLAETSTLGLRRSRVERVMLERKMMQVPTRFGEVSIKVAGKAGKMLKYAPEYEVCQRIAEDTGLSLNEVYFMIHSDAEKHFTRIGLMKSDGGQETEGKAPLPPGLD